MTEPEKHPTTDRSGHEPAEPVSSGSESEPLHPFHDTAWYRRLHSHPVLSAVTKVVVTAIGAVVLVVGVIMLVTPGPAFVLIPLGLAILAVEWAWARRLLVRARRAAERARQRAMALDPATRRRRTIAAVIVLAGLIAGGVVLGLWFRANVMD